MVEQFTIGERVWLDSERKPYRVRAAGKRFAVLTKPYNPKQTVVYTIVDREAEVRGTEDLIFTAGFETDQQCDQALARLEGGQTQISRRNYVPLKIMRRSAA